MSDYNHSLIAKALDSNYDTKRDDLRTYLIEFGTYNPLDPPINNHCRYLARRVTESRKAVREFELMAGMLKVDSAHSTIAHMRSKRRESEALSSTE